MQNFVELIGGLELVWVKTSDAYYKTCFCNSLRVKKILSWFRVEKSEAHHEVTFWSICR